MGTHSRHIKKQMRKKVLRDIFILAGVGVFFCVSLLLVWFSVVSITLPQPDVLGQKMSSGSTQIYDRTGKILLYEVGTRRFWVSYKEIPKNVVLGLLAAEDSEFFYHGGISVRGFLRAVWTNLKSGSFEQGGSTITQQLARTIFLTQEKTVPRKLKEAVLAIEIERKYSKEEILTFYLNSINFGEGNYGIKAAADFYFGKDLKSLTWEEIATLMSIPKSPYYYTPAKPENAARVLRRRNYILLRLKELGWIDEREYTTAKEKPVKTIGKKYFKIVAPHFVLDVKAVLENMFPKANLETAGLTVISTLDYDMQRVAENAIEKGAAQNEKKYGGKNASLLMMDTRDGGIRAMVGSRSFNDAAISGQVNMTMWPRQPGSAFKPFSYLTLFQLGYPAETILFDLPTNFGNYSPQNFDLTTRGPVSLRRALAESLNIPSVKVFYLADPNRVIENAKTLGLTTLKDYRYYGLSLGLGTAESRMVDLVRAYGVFSNDGELTSISLIEKITDTRKKIVYEYKPEKKRVIDSESVRLLNDVLKDYDARSGLFGASLGLTKIEGYDIALKTGTSQYYRDAWVFGYTPNFVVAVWSGNTNGKVMKPGGASLVASLPIWHDFISQIIYQFPQTQFSSPLPRTVAKPMLNGQWTSPLGIHEILYYVSTKNPLGPMPTNPASDPQFFNWEYPVQKWSGGEASLPQQQDITSNELPAGVLENVFSQ